jgi:ATP-dependent DNA helicase RecG
MKKNLKKSNSKNEENSLEKSKKNSEVKKTVKKNSANTLAPKSAKTLKISKNNLVNSTNRIVIGDVGSGKTIVAFFVALSYFKGLNNQIIFEKNEVCLVAPTEVLTAQHYESFYSFFGKSNVISDIDIVLFTSKLKKFNNQNVSQKELNKKLEQSQNKNIFWIGTHSLFFTTEIKPLLILIDEQHRFGVRQRQKLTELEEQISSHFVSFSATPIPRTLVTTLYGNLQPLILEKISGRNEVRTIIKSIDSFDDLVTNLIQDRINKNQKTLVICPKIEKNPEDDLFSVDEIGQKMIKHFGEKVMVIHGKIKNKNDILKEFSESVDKFILVSTTVIEVGVDVASATLIVIINAERFGLATLHQLRGRIGRNNFEDNLCVLMPSNNYEFSKRLRYMTQHSSGFDLAQKDLELRGGGDIFGVMQSGFEEEYDIIYSLPEDKIQEVNDLVTSIDFGNLKNDLPRLYNYLEKQIKGVWKE